MAVIRRLPTLSDPLMSSSRTQHFLVQLAFLLCLLCVDRHSVVGLIPKVCSENVTKSVAVCCPLDPENHLVCGGPSRGYCQEIHVPREEIPQVFRADDRVSWPLTFFSYACQCKANLFGIACEDCWFGWKGRDCDRLDVRIRRDIRSLSSHELELFKDIVHRSLTWPSAYVILDESTNYRSDPLYMPRFIPASVQYLVTFIHRYGSRTTLYRNSRDCDMFGILNFNHDGAVFPTWHRYFSLFWERLLADIAYKVHGIEGFALPYWDFIGLKHCDVCTNEYLGAPGTIDDEGQHISAYSPFANFTEFCYEPEDGTVCFGCQKARTIGTITRSFITLNFPDQRDVDYMMNLKDYFRPGERESDRCLSFHMALEGFCGRPDADPTHMWMHNKVHRIIDGSMCCSGTATNDPLFMILHTFVDKMYNTWFRRHRPTPKDYPSEDVRPGHSRDSFLIGIIPLARNVDMFVDSLQLGYDYDDDKFGKHAENRRGVLTYKTP